MSKYRIESRWPDWSRWRIVTPRPHAERNQFDKIGLYWNTWEQATAAKVAFEAVNSGEFRIVEEMSPSVIKNPDSTLMLQ